MECGYTAHLGSDLLLSSGSRPEAKDLDERLDGLPDVASIDVWVQHIALYVMMGNISQATHLKQNENVPSLPILAAILSPCGAAGLGLPSRAPQPETTLCVMMNAIARKGGKQESDVASLHTFASTLASPVAAGLELDALMSTSGLWD